MASINHDSFTKALFGGERLPEARSIALYALTADLPGRKTGQMMRERVKSCDARFFADLTEFLRRVREIRKPLPKFKNKWEALVAFAWLAFVRQGEPFKDKDVQQLAEELHLELGLGGEGVLDKGKLSTLKTKLGLKRPE